MEEVVVYTCIVRGYDKLIRQPEEPGVRYICFSDQPPARTAGWEVRPLISPPEITAASLINRYHKVLCYDRFPTADASIYLDGNVILRERPSALVRKLRDSKCSIAALPHDVRTTVAQEARACGRKLSPAQEEGVRALVEKLRLHGYPDDRGLSANYLLVRDTRDPVLRRSMERWWDCISNYVPRDQLSLQYSLWAEGARMHFLTDVPCDQIARRLKHGAGGLSLLDGLGAWGRTKIGQYLPSRADL